MELAVVYPQSWIYVFLPPPPPIYPKLLLYISTNLSTFTSVECGKIHGILQSGFKNINKN